MEKPVERGRETFRRRLSVVILKSSLAFFFPSFFFFFFFLLRPHMPHMEVLGLGVELELQLHIYTIATAMPDPRHICNLHLSLQQWWILNPLSKARDQTQFLWILVRLLTYWTTTRTPCFLTKHILVLNIHNGKIHIIVIVYLNNVHKQKCVFICSKCNWILKKWCDWRFLLYILVTVCKIAETHADVLRSILRVFGDTYFSNACKVIVNNISIFLVIRE